MARKKLEIARADIPQADAEVVTTAMQALDTINQMQVIQSSALEVGDIRGQVKTALFMRSIADRIVAQAFINLKEGKKYKDLQIKAPSGEVRQIADLQEACELLFDKSYRTCAELAQNLELLGADLYDKAEQLKLTTKDYRAIRALPTDDQALIESSLNGATDREAIAELIEELTERHAKKLAEAQKKVADAVEDSEAKDRVIAAKNERENDLLRQIARYEGDKVPADERLAAIVEATEESGKAVEDAVNDLWKAFEAADTVTADIFDKPLNEQDAVGARNAVARIRDQIQRAANAIAELQFNYDNRLAPVLSGHDGYELRTGTEG
jgi:chromosome segregation ATPase